MIGVEHIRRQGVATVALLAAAHGLRVRLLPASPRGTIAEVEVPAEQAPDPDTGACRAAGRADRRRTTPRAGRLALTCPCPPARHLALVVLRLGAPVLCRRRYRRRSCRRSPRSGLLLAGRNRHPSFTRLPSSTARRDGSRWAAPCTCPPRPGRLAGSATTSNGLPRRQPSTAFTPPSRPAPVAPPRGARAATGLAQTAGAYQRGLGRRSLQPREGQR